MKPSQSFPPCKGAPPPTDGLPPPQAVAKGRRFLPEAAVRAYLRQLAAGDAHDGAAEEAAGFLALRALCSERKENLAFARTKCCQVHWSPVCFYVCDVSKKITALDRSKIIQSNKIIT